MNKGRKEHRKKEEEGEVIKILHLVREIKINNSEFYSLQKLYRVRVNWQNTNMLH